MARIEIERAKMHILAFLFGITHPFTIAQSQYLDELILLEQRKACRW